MKRCERITIGTKFLVARFLRCMTAKRTILDDRIKQKDPPRIFQERMTRWWRSNWRLRPFYLFKVFKITIAWVFYGGFDLQNDPLMMLKRSLIFKIERGMWIVVRLKDTTSVPNELRETNTSQVHLNTTHVLISDYGRKKDRALGWSEGVQHEFIRLDNLRNVSKINKKRIVLLQQSFHENLLSFHPFSIDAHERIIYNPSLFVWFSC